MNVKLDQIKGVGPQTLRILRNKGIWTTYDLVLNTPKAYDDYSLTSLYHIKDKDEVTLQGQIKTNITTHRFNKSGLISFTLKTIYQDVKIVAFGKAYLAKTFAKDDEVIVKGTYQLYKKQVIAKTIIQPEKKVDIKPLYHIEGIYDTNLSSMMRIIFDEDLVSIYENIPRPLLDKYHLLSRKEAFYNLHFPKTQKDIYQAERRFKYEEAFFLHLKLILSQPSMFKRTPKSYDIHKVRALIDRIPYSLTKDQKEAVNDIFRDFKKDYSSYRLIQGDVGSGKTIVSLIAIYAAITAGEQVTLMAPTEMLAQQHFQYFFSMINDVKIALLTGKTKQKDQLKTDIKNQQIDFVIGTQALIEEDVMFKNLGLIVIDEQHKFGVQTRDELITKAKSKDILYLTATPIPRTLAKMMFGHSHVSIIKEKPNMRQPVETIYVTKDKINDLYETIKYTISRREHVFIVVPAITSNKVDDNIETVHQALIERFNTNIYVLHGNQPKAVQESMMESFIYDPGSILLSTTMIEVGIDLPTATLMAIYSAEHFGLSQLHQLRGRVGRSHLKSTCFLISEKEDIERLQFLSREQDGFKLSEFDLIQRGPGDFLGDKQSGFLDFKYLNLLEDQHILDEAYKNVKAIITQPDFLTNPKYKYLNRFIKEEKLMI